jgi:hypothetical protein
MRGRTKLAAATVGVIAAAGAATGVVAAAGNGSGDPAADLAAAINKRAGTSITAADISGAYQDLLKARLDAAVAAGKLTQAQADDMLARAKDAPLGGPGFGPPGPGGPGHVARAELLAPVATLLDLSEDQLRTKLRAGSTLAQIAKAQGVSRADLVAAIAKAVKTADPDLTDARAAAIAGRIADGKGPRGERRGGPPFGGPPPGGPELHVGP